MSSPRSQALIVLKSASVGQNKTFGVPADHVVLVKAIVVRNAGTAAALAQVWASSSAAVTNVYLVSRELAANEIWTWSGSVALNTGDAVSVQLWGIDMETWVSGSVLAGANQFPIATMSWEEFLFVQQLPAPR